MILKHNSDYFPKEHPSFSLSKSNSPVCEAGTKIFIFHVVNFSLQVAVGRRTLTADFRVWSRVSPWLFLSTKQNWEKFYLRMLRFSTVTFIPPVPHTHLHLNTVLIRRKPGSLEHINTSAFRFFSFWRVKLKRNRSLNLMSSNVNVRPTCNYASSPPYISTSRWLITTRSNFTLNRDELEGNITNCTQLTRDGPGQSHHSPEENDRNHAT
jgi:hypothetical protein